MNDPTNPNAEHPPECVADEPTTPPVGKENAADLQASHVPVAEDALGPETAPRQPVKRSPEFCRRVREGIHRAQEARAQRAQNGPAQPTKSVAPPAIERLPGPTVKVAHLTRPPVSPGGGPTRTGAPVPC